MTLSITGGRVRLIALGLAVVAAIAGIAVATVLAVSEWKQRRQHDAPVLPLRISAPADIAEG